MFKHNLRKQVLFISITLFIVSLTQECYCTETSCIPSLQPFIIGWAALYIGGPMLIWLANPILLVSWLASKNSLYTSLIFSFAASVIAMAFLFIKAIYNHDDAGITTTITHYKPGYWLWVASCWSMFIGNTAIVCKAKKFNSSVAVILLLIVGITVIFLGMHTTKQLVFSKYKFNGNLDTLNNKYRALERSWGLDMCESYLLKKDMAKANNITRIYHRCGYPLKIQQLNNRRYPTVDSIVKYRKQVFDTTIVQP